MSGSEATEPRRILVTGLSTFWGSRLVSLLEAEPGIEAILGVDPGVPSGELTRAEFVRVGPEHGAIERLIEGARIDTVVDTRMALDLPGGSSAAVHENNVIGTLNLLAACSVADSPVRRLVFRSSGLFYGSSSSDPAYFTERSDPPADAATRARRDLIEAESAVATFRSRRPEVAVTVLRFADVLGPGVESPLVRLFGLPAIPSVAGFDPRLQFVDQEDAVHALAHAVDASLNGVFNVAADGVPVLSEVADLLGKRVTPVIPPLGGGLTLPLARRFGLPVSDDLFDQLRFGRALENRAFKGTGFHFRFTSREAVVGLRSHLLLDRVAGGVEEPYRYEPEVEDFLRRSDLVDDRPGDPDGR